MNFSEPSVKKRRLSTSQLGFIVGQLKACSGTNIPPTGNALDILSIDSSELLRLCDTQNIAVTYQDVQSLKVHVASTLLTSQSKDSLAEWSSSLPDLLSPLTHHPLPRQVFFGKAELDDLFPSLPHPSLLELLETKQEESYPGHAVCISHQVAMTLVVASAARGAKVLLLDTGIGTEIEQLLMHKCTEFCQTQPYTSDAAIEQLLERVTVQRCYDPFSLLAALASLPSLPLKTQPDILILMDWMKVSLPFMTGLDLLQHRRQFGDFGGDTGNKERKISSEASVRPLLAEVVLSLQRLTVPRTDPPTTASATEPAAALERKATSVVILNSLHHLHHATQAGSHFHATSTSSSSTSLSPFGYLLADSVDFSVRLGERTGGGAGALDEQGGHPHFRNTPQYSADPKVLK